MTVFPSLNSTEANADGIELGKSTLAMNMTISRRQFCGALGAGLAVANANLFAVDSKPKPIRIIAYNNYGFTGWPNERNLAKQAVATGQMAKRLAMELALHEPDIINFSESPKEELTKEVAELLGMNHVRLPIGLNFEA